jgi:hypothetical protein
MYKNRPYILTFTFIIFSILLIYLFLWPDIGRARDSSKSTLDNSKTLTKIQKLSIPFIPNQGQTDKRVKFYANTFGGTVFVTEKGEIIYSLPKIDQERKAIRRTPKTHKELGLKEELVGGRVKGVKAEEEAITKVSQFIGNDSSKWRSNIPTYGLVSLGEVYQGIEVKLKAYGKSVEKLFYVEAGADPRSIRLRLNGGESLRVNEEGELEVKTALGDVKFSKPLAYQEVDGRRIEIPVDYRILNSEPRTPNSELSPLDSELCTERRSAFPTNSELIYSFKVGDYDRTRKLVIDPILQSTYLGGSSHDYAHSIAIDSGGNVYVTGMTYSTDFPGTAGGAQPAGSGYYYEGFVTKFNSSLTSILQSTYLGGSSIQEAYSIAIDSVGNVYVAGYTSSTDFPGTAGGAQPSLGGGYDGFVTKFNSSLTSILQSTYLGGSGEDYASSIAVDSSANVYVAGYTASTNFPGTTGGAQPSFGGVSDIFISKLNSSLTHILQSTYLGGSGIDRAKSIVIDSNRNVYVAGETASTNFPGTSGGAQPSLGGGGYSDTFVTKFNSSLTSILQSTYLGGSGEDYAYSIAIDSVGNVYVAGMTYSTDFPGTAGGAQPSLGGGYDGFVTKFNSSLTSILQSTYLGGSDDDCAKSIVIDSVGNVYVAGETESTDFPGTTGGAQPSHGGGYYNDAFVTKFNSSLTSILQSTYLGGIQPDSALSIVIDSVGNVYVAGWTGSLDFPGTTGGAQPSPGGGGYYDDAFVAKLDSRLAATLFSDVSSGFWADFDGNGTTDVAAFHLPSDQFFTDYAGNLGQFGWGGSDSMPLVWDYDGDGKTDVSIYHIPTNQWFVKGVGNLGQFGWGGADSIPVPGDYNGDGRMERAFYHSPTNQWFVEGQDPVQFGWNGAECIPLPGDYDGDGKTDMVIYHIPSNQWFQYGVGNLGQFGWGGADCIPVPGDYNGDGKTEIAVYHVPTNQWFVKGMGNLGQYGWGGLESFPIPGDYNGDGVMERGFYRPSENRWFIEGESDFVWGWGGSDFMPITSSIAVYNWFRFVLGKFK